ncbi:MAG: hypothetical protein LN575_04710 [Rickettsia endosymbiont of Gnoriste bilineata]|nr:hypothetical protein [Rickettsia endosymbiont of Gnoriste bilineata]
MVTLKILSTEPRECFTIVPSKSTQSNVLSDLVPSSSLGFFSKGSSSFLTSSLLKSKWRDFGNNDNLFDICSLMCSLLFLQ